MTIINFNRTRDSYLISSDPSLLSHAAISAALSHPQTYWAKPLSPSALTTCINSSLILGLYISNTPPGGAAGLETAPKPTQIGLARLITDYTTFAYLTDVFIQPEEQGKGLGKWLIQCVGEVVEGFADLRKMLLICSKDATEKFYERELGMKRWGTGTENGAVIMQRSGGGAVTHSEDEAGKVDQQLS